MSRSVTFHSVLSKLSLVQLSVIHTCALPDTMTRLGRVFAAERAAITVVLLLLVSIKLNEGNKTVGR